MKMTGATEGDGEHDESVKHLGHTGDGEISLVSAASSEEAVDNSKSARKHRQLLAIR